ncbi:MAG: prenyltransferase/squalene oxidase repeat-containing protein, partial [Thermoguttaceae bacterium]
DSGGFDEGSTTITQIQGLRGCRNAGIPVPKEIIDKAVKYIKNCTGADGGVQYNSKGGGGRPAITAAAVACLFNAGEYDSQYVPKLLEYCHRQLDNITNQGFGHWHYAHYYYSQVLYREGGKAWESYRDKIFERIVQDAGADGSWSQGYIGPVFTTAVNLTILQLPKGALPIYQR